jgi:hypothetical protein
MDNHRETRTLAQLKLTSEGGPLDDLSGSNLVGDVVWENLDSRAHRRCRSYVFKL